MDLTKVRKGFRIGLASLAAVALTGGLASANGNIRSWNMTTGSSSSNETSVEVNHDHDVSATFDSTADNTTTVSGDNSDNDATDNTGDANVEVGGFRGTIRTSTVLNESGDEVSLPESSMPDVSVGNEETGSSSDNDATATADSTTTLDISRSGSADNTTVGTFANGDNDANDNTGDARIRVRGNNVSSITQTDINSSAGASLMADGMSHDMGDVEAINDTTGSGSSNTAAVTLNHSFSSTEDSSADVTNDTVITMDGGDNDANDNTGDAEIVVDESTFNVVVENFLN